MLKLHLVPGAYKKNIFNHIFIQVRFSGYIFNDRGDDTDDIGYNLYVFDTAQQKE